MMQHLVQWHQACCYWSPLALVDRVRWQAGGYTRPSEQRVVPPVLRRSVL